MPYTAAPDGNDRVKVYDSEKGILLYSLSIGNGNTIKSVICTGEDLSVTFEDNSGATRMNVYGLKKGIKKYSKQISQAPVTLAQNAPRVKPVKATTPKPSDTYSQPPSAEDMEGLNRFFMIIFKFTAFSMLFAPFGIIDYFYPLNPWIDKFYSLNQPVNWKWVLALALNIPLFLGQYAFMVLHFFFLLVLGLIAFLVGPFRTA